MMTPILEKLKRKEALTPAEMTAAMEAIVTGAVQDPAIEEFLTELRQKGETVAEITAAAHVMRRHALKLSKHFPDLLDTCGTGGDARRTLNISTLSAIVASSAGVQVGKHGNRSVSSTCGSADLLEALGVKIDLSVSAIERSIETVGFGFFFAPQFHPATRFAMPARKRIQGKTLFNLLGPLSNPGGALHQLIGVYDEKLVKVLAEALRELGAKRALVVHGLDGLDEITNCERTSVAELDGGRIRTYSLTPEEFGLKRGSLSDLQCASREEAKDRALEVLEGRAGPASDVVCLNTGAALFVAGKVKTIREGLELSKELIETEEAFDKLEEIRSFTPDAVG
ncbi:MAG: anthranilate phosphoribosyltransferase [Candidatus Omnitrophota bacterium]